MTATQAPPTYSSTQVRYRTGISERQLDYWCQQDWLRPTFRNRDGECLNHGGKGIDRRFTQDELDRARMMARLVALGVTAGHAARIAHRPEERWGWLADVMAACKAMEP